MFPIPENWTLDSKDWARDEKKREVSPASFFMSQGPSLELAARDFVDSRLQKKSRGGVARKHRHRINLALFGQLMAAFEYMLKDLLATVIDTTDAFDGALQKTDWLEIDVPRILAQRSLKVGIGGILVHPTLGWHKPETVNGRYKNLCGFEPIANDEVAIVSQLWLVRHSVAHNAGWVTGHDAFRLGAGGLSEKVVNVDRTYLGEAFKFLKPIAGQLASGVGSKLIERWVQQRASSGKAWDRDCGTYERLKWLATCIESRTRALPEVTEEDYLEDWKKYASGTKRRTHGA